MAGIIPYIEDRDESFMLPLTRYTIKFVASGHEARRGYPYVTGPGAQSSHDVGSDSPDGLCPAASSLEPFIHNGEIPDA